MIAERQEHKGRRIPTRGLIGGVLALVFFGFIAKEVITQGPEADHVKEQLTTEMRLIAQPVGARRVDTVQMSKPRHVLVGERYVVSAPKNNVSTHYLHELGNRGWTRCGGNEATERYCKDHFAATVTFRDAGADAGWNVALDLTWDVQ